MKLIEGVPMMSPWRKIPKGKPPRPLPKDIILIWKHNVLTEPYPSEKRDSTLGAKWYGANQTRWGFWIAGHLSKRKITKIFWKHHAHEYFKSKQVIK